jgi:hypothetical protein
VVRPLLAGCGATPQSLAKAASLRIRVELSLTVTRNWPAISTSTGQLHQVGGGRSHEGIELPVQVLDLLVEQGGLDPAISRRSGWLARLIKSSVAGRSRGKRLTNVRLDRSISLFRSGEGNRS